MYRVLSIAVALVLAIGGAASGSSGTNIDQTNAGLVVTAGSPGSLAISSMPGRLGTGPTIYCGWFNVRGGFGLGDIDLVGDPVSPEVGFIYAVNCWTTDRDKPYPGYYIMRTNLGSPDIPGAAVSTSEAARFAISHLNFEPPVIAVSPPQQQVVGIPTWLAVTSRLNYNEVSANAGPVWATVRASFRDVTWDLGNGSRRVCSQDVSKVWDPTTNQPQSSRCTYTYTNSSGSPFNVTATIRWNIVQRNNINPDWHWWGTISRSTTIPLHVGQLQSAIR